MRRYLPPVVAAAVLTATLSSASAAAADARLDGEASVLAWNSTTVQTIVSVTGPPVPPPVGAVYLAYVHRAVYDAVQDAAARSASIPAAVAAAAHDVLDAYFPGDPQQAIIDPAYTAALGGIPNGSAKVHGIAAGEAAAQALLDDRRNDGLNGPALSPDPYLPGVWTPAVANTPATASWLGNMRPFVLLSSSQFRPGGPPPLSSDRYARDFKEIREHGSAANRDVTETDVGRFWADHPGVQSQRALRLYADEQNLDAMAAARLFALTNTASADSLIACAEAKFHFDFWRPFTAVPRAGEDGNPRTQADANWAPLVPTPNFPEYPSNHSCTTTATATVIDGLDGSGPFSLTIQSTNAVAPATQTFTSPEEVIQDVANGRVFGGLHFRFSTTDGTQIGRAVGALVLATYR